MFSDKIIFSEFEMLTRPELFEQIKSGLGKLEWEKSSVKSRQSFSAFLDHLLDDYRKESLKNFIRGTGIVFMF